MSIAWDFIFPGLNFCNFPGTVRYATNHNFHTKRTLRWNIPTSRFEIITVFPTLHDAVNEELFALRNTISFTVQCVANKTQRIMRLASWMTHPQISCGYECSEVLSQFSIIMVNETYCEPVDSPDSEGCFQNDESKLQLSIDYSGVGFRRYFCLENRYCNTIAALIESIFDLIEEIIHNFNE